MSKLRLGIVGNGFLANVVVEALKDGLLEEYELVGILGRSPEKTEALADKAGCKACKSLSELLELKPDYVAEAASVQAVKDMAEQILSSGSGLVVISVGALADEAFRSRVSETAKSHGTKLYVASGAVGGFDVLRTIRLMGASKASFVSKKSPGSLKNTPLFEEHLMTDEESSLVYDGNAGEVIGLLPTKMNVAVATSLAASGPENLDMNIHSVPEMVGDDYVITEEAPGVRAVVNIYSSTSAIAGWSMVAVLQNIVAPIVF